MDVVYGLDLWISSNSPVDLSAWSLETQAPIIPKSPADDPIEAWSQDMFGTTDVGFNRLNPKLVAWIPMSGWYPPASAGQNPDLKLTSSWRGFHLSCRNPAPLGSWKQWMILRPQQVDIDIITKNGLICMIACNEESQSTKTGLEPKQTLQF